MITLSVHVFEGDCLTESLLKWDFSCIWQQLTRFQLTKHIDILHAVAALLLNNKKTSS